MPTGFYTWSQIANANANADSGINFAEGQAPSSVNDSARAMMAVLARYRDDISGAIVTSGTSTAYTVTSNTGFDSLPDMGNQVIAFTPHATNGATVTLSVDGLAAKPLRSSPGVELPASSLILGTPYVALYNKTDSVFYLMGGLGGANAYSIPLGAGLDYWGSTTPNSIFAFPAGQAISRTTYATLFSLFGTTYGTGDGSTTFNLPDKSERVSVMKAATATRLTSTYFGGDSTALGAVGGSDNHALVTAEIPAVPFSGSTGNDTPDHVHGGGLGTATKGGVSAGGSFLCVVDQPSANTGGASTRHTHPFSGNISGGAGAHANVQPTIVTNYIMRVI